MIDILEADILEIGSILEQAVIEGGLESCLVALGMCEEKIDINMSSYCN